MLRINVLCNIRQMKFSSNFQIHEKANVEKQSKEGKRKQEIKWKGMKIERVAAKSRKMRLSIMHKLSGLRGKKTSSACNTGFI